MRAARMIRLRFLALSLEFLREQRFLFFFTCRFLYRYIAYSDIDAFMRNPSARGGRFTW